MISMRVKPPVEDRVRVVLGQPLVIVRLRAW